MSNAIQIVPSGIGVNANGLRGGQAQLYKYFLECERENKQIDMWTVTEIYYRTVAYRQNHMYYDGQKWLNCSLEKWLEWAKAYYPNYSHTSPKNWLKMNIGSFVLRGLLSVMPKFKPEDQE